MIKISELPLAGTLADTDNLLVDSPDITSRVPLSELRKSIQQGQSIIICHSLYDPAGKVHVLSPVHENQFIPESGVVPVTFIPDADFHAGDKLRFNGQDCDAAYNNTDLAVADGAFRAGIVTSAIFQFVETGGGTDRTCLAILHNGEALYARDAGKLNGLAPEAYIQPQDNMLDNGYFKINQNNKTEYLTFGISVDRWTVNRAIVKVYADCISLRWNGTDRDNGNIFERIERDALLPNAIYTFSVLVKDVGLLSVTFTTKTEAPSEPIFIAQKRFGDLELSVHDTPESYQFNVYTYSTKESYLKAAKAEPGAYFTGWPVWNYALELAKCQRYALEMVSAFNTKFGEIGIGSATNTTRAVVFCPTPVSLRVKPAVSFAGDFRLVESGSWQAGVPVTSITVNQVSANGVSLYVDTAGGLSAGKWYKLVFNDSEQNSLLLNANL